MCVCSSGRQDIRRGRRHKRVDGMKADEPWQNSYISIPGGLVLPPSSSSLLYIPSRFLLYIFFLFRLFYNFFFVPSEFVVLICFFLALIYKTVMVLVPMSRRLSPCCVRSIHRDLCTTSIHFSSYSLVWSIIYFVLKVLMFLGGPKLRNAMWPIFCFFLNWQFLF